MSKGILESIDMDSYRVEKQAVKDHPASRRGCGDRAGPHRGRRAEARTRDGPAFEHHPKEFNDLFGDIEWKDGDKIGRVISEELPAKVARDKAYQNALANSDLQNARIEHDRALERAMTELLADHTELFKQFSDNESFRKWLYETVFEATHDSAAVRVSSPR